MAEHDCGGCHPIDRYLSAYCCDISIGIEFNYCVLPDRKGTLIETDPYRLVRHPMYCGGILIAFGWAFLVHGWLTNGYAVIMMAFFDFKSRREEEWLKNKLTGYSEYQKRVHKLISFIY